MLQELSDKQKISLKESDARLNVWEGSVRSGKSFSALLRFIEFAMSDIKGDMCIVGRTEDAIKRNIISELSRLLGTELRYFAGKRQIHLWNRKIYVIGASDERSEAKIRGATFAGALVDEATTIPETFFKMLLSRLSIDGAKLFATTNPDSPFHYIKTEYLDRESELDLKRFKFVIEDNPSLTEAYKENLKKEYRGLWYRRFIDGDWVLAEGAVYDFFDEDLHCIDFPTSRGKYYVIGIDYGTVNACTFSLFGYNPDKYPNIWKEKEYYWDSKKQIRQKTDSEYAEDLINFSNGYNVKAILVDPSAGSFIAECRKQGIRNIMDANNEVLSGIRYYSQLLTQGTLKICKQCKMTLQEMQTYVWDEKAAMRGEEKPKKKNDHCFTGETLVTTLEGQKPIKEVSMRDKVLTREGYKDVLKTWKHYDFVKEFDILGKYFRCTPEHKFFTLNKGWVESFNLTDSDMLLVEKPEELKECLKLKSRNLTGSNTEDILSQKISQMPDILDVINLMQCKDMDISIEMCGNITKETFPLDTMFIISTGIPSTMTLAISNYWSNQITYDFMQKAGQKKEETCTEFILVKSEGKQKNGIEAKKEENGTESMLEKLQTILSQKDSFVSNVTKSSSQNHAEQSNFVRISVSQHGEELLVLMMSIESVLSALNHSRQTSIQNKSCVVRDVPGNIEEVYNLTIYGIPEFFANNILVHNCLDADRYAVMYWYDNGLTQITAEELDDRFHRFMGGRDANLPAFFRDTHY